MKILFIFPDVWGHGGDFYYGIGYISAVLKMNGHQTSLLHLTKEISRKSLIGKVREIEPDLVGLTSTSHQFGYAKEWAAWIKQAFNLPVVCGGTHSTVCPDEVISSSGIDVVCIGEGEYPLLELADALESGRAFDQIENLWIKKGEAVKRNPMRALISDLDSLPFPDREVFSYQDVLRRESGVADFIAGRGCPFGCTYCCNHALRGIYKGKGPYVRLRSVKSVIAEIGEVLDRYGSLVKAINFDDDTFTLSHKWVRDFCDAYREEFDIPFTCNARADTVNGEILSSLKAAGCETIRIGVESGNEWLRRTVLNRAPTDEQIIAACTAAREAGLSLYIFNMLGLPHETPSMAEDTIALTRKIAPNRVQTSIFYPYPGTELYELCKREGLLTDRCKKSYFDRGSTLNLPTLTEEQIDEYYMKLKELDSEFFISTYYRELLPVYRAVKRIVGPGRISARSWFRPARIVAGYRSLLRRANGLIAS